MQYYTNDNSDRDSIVHDTLYLCGLPTVSASFSSYSLHDITRNSNIHYQDAVSKIWQAADGWQYDDSNKTDLPIGTTNLTNNQQDYTLPTDAQRISRIEVMDSNGDYQKVEQKDIHDVNVAMSEYYDEPGMPLYYDLIGRSVMLYPIPVSGAGGATLTSGMRVYFDRTPDEFETNGTTASTTSPGFADPFHRLISLGNAIDYEQDKSRHDRLVAMRTAIEKGLTEFYSKRNVERPAQIRPKKNWRNYL